MFIMHVDGDCEHKVALLATRDCEHKVALLAQFGTRTVGVRGLDGDSIFDMASERERARAMNVFLRFQERLSGQRSKWVRSLYRLLFYWD